MKNKKQIQNALDGLVTARGALEYLVTKDGEQQTSTTAVKRLVDKGKLDFVIQGKGSDNPTRLFFIEQLENLYGITL